VYSDLSEFCFKSHFLSLSTAHKIHSVYKDNNSKYLILFSHGNASNISKLSNIYNFYDKLGVSYVVFDYPGYGKSTGRASEQLLYQSIREVFEFTKNELGYNQENIILHGLSLGGAVAIDLASKINCRSAIFESTFTSTRDMGKFMFPKLKLYKYVKNKFNSIDKIDKIRMPKLFIHGKKDITVPFKMGEELFDKASNPKFFYSLENVGHNDQIDTGGAEYFQVFERFISDSKI
jgi:hypothetical protein